MKFYRYQNTQDIEHNSRYVDLHLLYEDITEYESKYNSKKELLDALYHKYFNSLSLRHITAEELFKKVISSDNNTIEDLESEYPVIGIFGRSFDEINTYYTIKDLLEKEPPWICDGWKYLVVYDGTKILDEGDDGIIFKPIKILKIYKTINGGI